MNIIESVLYIYMKFFIFCLLLSLSQGSPFSEAFSPAFTMGSRRVVLLGFLGHSGSIFINLAFLANRTPFDSASLLD